MRTEIPIAVINSSGAAVANATVQINVRGGAAAIIYQYETGPQTLTNPLTTDVFGRASGWLDRGAYDCTISAANLLTYVEQIESVPGRDGGVDTAWTADSSITTAKLADSSITTVKLADSSITTVKLADLAVTAAKIADATITAGKLAVGAGGAVRDVLANRPAAASVPGQMFYATDQKSLTISTGTSWERIGHEAGDILWTAETAARTGYLICTGQAWPSTTGIYADLFARWGGAYPTNLPDFQAREFIAKGSHADVNTIGFNDGLAVGNRRPKHKHAFAGTAGTTGTDSVDHSHYVPNVFTNPPGSPPNEAGGAENPVRGQQSQGVNTWHTHSFTPAGTVGPQTGAEPTDSAAYIVLVPQVKL